ncbi:lipase secretion chaperone [Enterovibrio nigricans]|uniref:Lipase chaperone n=1 Tax=Enterovibrio nigricans DSM 22720 TaxID=1121868 RepID=A0A1T4VKA1_9GAMM|nr:lipase secretion chaperone [Enterovibrio nigricans]PKF49642.1 hypothetical protein AT251_17465 [Enterovibrio nigricans]SKA65298.1 Lipase chaperone LimK [Enterovibrio nigricans DSM 22720]
MRISFTAYKIALILVVGILLAVVLYLMLDDEDKPITQARSHQGTSVDTSSHRDTFEYFLSTLGERNINDVQHAYNTFADSVSYGENQKPLFEKYQAYRRALDSLNAPDSLSGLDYLYFVQTQVTQLQAALFDDQERAQLFYEENLAREMAIKRMELEALNIDDKAMQQQWQDELDKLTPDMKASYQNAALIGQINHVMTSDDEQNRIQLNELVGEEAAARIKAFEQEEAKFEQNLSAYFAEKSQRANPMSGSDLKSLKDKYFTREQQRRVNALENMRSDSQ